MKIIVYLTNGKKLVFNQAKECTHEWDENNNHYLIIKNEDNDYYIPFKNIKGWDKYEQDF